MLLKTAEILGYVGIIGMIFMTYYSLQDFLISILLSNLFMFFFLMSTLVVGFGIVLRGWWKFMNRIGTYDLYNSNGNYK